MRGKNIFFKSHFDIKTCLKLDVLRLPVTIIKKILKKL